MVTDLELTRKWVTATGIFSALLSILLMHTVFVRGFSFAYWNLFFDRGSGSIGIWQFYLNFYQLTVSFAFKIVLAILLLRSGRILWSRISDKYIPPYEKQTISEPPLPTVATSPSYSTKRSLQMMAYFFCIAIVLSVSLIYVDSALGLLYSKSLQTQLQAVSDRFFIEIIAEIIQIPLGSFETIPFEPQSDATLLITVVHVWIPSIPISLFLVNFYSFNRRMIHIFLFSLFDERFSSDN